MQGPCCGEQTFRISGIGHLKVSETFSTFPVTHIHSSPFPTFPSEAGFAQYRVQHSMVTQKAYGTMNTFRHAPGIVMPISYLLRRGAVWQGPFLKAHGDVCVGEGMNEQSKGRTDLSATSVSSTFGRPPLSLYIFRNNDKEVGSPRPTKWRCK